MVAVISGYIVTGGSASTYASAAVLHDTCPQRALVDSTPDQRLVSLTRSVWRNPGDVVVPHLLARPTRKITWRYTSGVGSLVPPAHAIARPVASEPVQSEGVALRGAFSPERRTTHRKLAQLWIVGADPLRARQGTGSGLTRRYFVSTDARSLNIRHTDCTLLVSWPCDVSARNKNATPRRAGRVAGAAMVRELCSQSIIPSPLRS